MYPSLPLPPSLPLSLLWISVLDSGGIVISVEKLASEELDLLPKNIPNRAVCGIYRPHLLIIVGGAYQDYH